MRKPPKSTRRQRKGFREQKRVFRLHVEGKITEREYFQCIKSPDVYLSFAQSSGLDPKSLVRNARSDIKHKSRRKSYDEFDELWCVFDVDQHERLAEALSDARNGGINVAVSNPCFELWLVLHTDDQSAFVSRTQIQKTSQRLGLTDGKHLADNACEQLIKLTGDAKKRAIVLSNSHQAAGATELANPSSSVWRLVDELRSAS